MRKILFILFIFMQCAIYAQPNTVNIGSAGNDGTGDPLRTAMQKLNANDAAIYDTLGNHLDTLQNHYTTVQTLKTGGFIKNSSYTTCPHNDTTNITIGSSLTDMAWFIHYVAYQTIYGVDYIQAGTIEVLYNSSTEAVTYSSSYAGPDVGITIESDKDASDIRLNLIVAYDFLMNNRYFDYRIISKFKQ